MAIATEAGFGEHQVAFVTAYTDRDAGAFKGSVTLPRPLLGITG